MPLKIKTVNRVLQNSNDEEISGIIAGDILGLFVGAVEWAIDECRNGTYSTDPIDCLKSMGRGAVKGSGAKWFFSRLPK